MRGLWDKRGVVVMAVALLVATPSWAARRDRLLTAIDNSVGLAFVHQHVLYGEKLGGPGSSGYFDTDSGFLEGGRISVSALGDDDLYMHLSYGQTVGNLNYVGASTNLVTGATTPLVEQEAEQMVTAALRIGASIITGRHSQIVPYLTYGLRHWSRGAFVPSCVDCYESYRNGYVAAGALWQWAFTPDLASTVNVAYGRTVNAQINVPGFLSEGLGARPWMRAGVSLDLRVSRADTVFVRATYTQFSYGAGAVTAVGFEPYSRTATTDYMVGARFLVGLAPRPW
ncbi:MAG: hypothetical protein ACYCXG_11510 [Acidiferrobacter sp.]